MDLKTYIQKEQEKGNDIDLINLSEIFEVSYETLRSVANRDRDASLWLAIKIHEYTKGEVQLRDLLKMKKIKLYIQDRE